MLILGLGSNLEPRRTYLKKAVRLLRQNPLFHSVRLSPVYESPPLLPEGAPESWHQNFLNLAVSVQLNGDPDYQHVLHQMKSIEKQLGRMDRERWAPREIDIDLLAWNENQLHHEDLNLPHQDLLNRSFALKPLADLWPNWRYPVAGPDQGKHASQLVWEKGYGDLTRARPLFPEWMGILNITPDSFSDGGEAFQVKDALRQAQEHFEAGASLLDLGAESTRPGATPLNPQEEWQRLAPVLKELRAAFPALTLSIDTRHSEVAEKALEANADWINDVTGLTDPKMIDVVKGASCPLIFMHSLSTPVEKKKTLPAHQNPVEAVYQWSQKQLEWLESKGIEHNRLIFDPGVGFGKTAEQSLALIQQARVFTENLPIPILIGHSRKSFLNPFTEQSFSKRDLETALVSGLLSPGGVDYLRVHAVAPNQRANELSYVLNQP